MRDRERHWREERGKKGQTIEIERGHRHREEQKGAEETIDLIKETQQVKLNKSTKIR